MLAYGVPADSTDEYVQIGATTAIDSFKFFIQAVVEVFGDEYLRSPNNDDLVRLLDKGKERGFPGMIGSTDCMHWTWKNCPTAWHGMYTGHAHEPTIILEAVASHDLWIWHAFFGMPGSLNDINVLERSSVFNDIAEGRTPEISYVVNGRTYNMGYYLADGIYPEWPTLVKTIPDPRGNKNQNFALQQEAARKDVERAFGVLQQRFAIVRGPVKYWDQDILNYIMTACIIMHNMIVEDERPELRRRRNQTIDGEREYEQSKIPLASPSFERTPDLMEFIENRRKIRDRHMHTQLQMDLIEHLWKELGNKEQSRTVV